MYRFLLAIFISILPTGVFAGGPGMLFNSGAAGGGDVAIVQSAVGQTTGEEDNFTITPASTPTTGNDLYIFVAYYGNYGALTPTLPAGWTLVETAYRQASSLAVFRKTSAGDETSINVAITEYSDWHSGIFVEIDNAGTTNYVDGSASNSLSTPSATPGADGSLPLAFVAVDSGTPSGFTITSGWTTVASTSATYHGGSLVKRDTLTSGSTGISHTWTGTATAPVSSIHLVPPA